MKRTFYILLYILVYLISLLPLRVLYGISDFLYIIVYTVWGYRKKIVRKNLTESFPEKGRDELLAIEKGFSKKEAEQKCAYSACKKLGII